MIGRKIEMHAVPSTTRAEHLSHWAGVAALGFAWFIGCRNGFLIFFPLAISALVRVILD